MVIVAIAVIARPPIVVIVIVAMIGLGLRRLAPRRAGGVVLRKKRRRLWLRGRLIGRHRSLDNLVDFAAIKPDATALGTIVDLDAVTLGHDEIHPTVRTEQTDRFSLFMIASNVDARRRLSIEAEFIAANLTIRCQAMRWASQ